jgi:glycosyltransferase involved in cell wall biosynthesis
MIEAMACGTPVIAFRAGSVPEVIEDGVTGFVVEDEEEAVQAIRRLPELDRRKVRKRFEERFSAARMARDYVALYETLGELANVRSAAR